MIDKNIIIKQNQADFLNRLLVCLLIAALVINSYAENGGIIVLNQPAPETSVIVTATEQVILKPGFRASAATGTFNAKIGASNSIAPLFNIAEESTFVIPVASNDQNYIKTSTALTADANSPMITTVQYFDGLGRHSQTVQMGSTPEGADLVSFTEYDGVGREWRNWLPAPFDGNFGQFIDEYSFTSDAATKYNDNKPYTEIKYEPSPLNRIEEQFGAGTSWHTNNKRVVTNYNTNDGNVAYFHINESGNLARNGNYSPATLYKTTVTDEDEKPVSEYKDKLGRIVLKEGALNTRTYYVYNDLGQLSYVIPPIAADSLPNTAGQINDDHGVLKRYAYLYKYDVRGNQTYKRLPGCEPIRMVYDKANRLILSQDGNQQLKQQWLVYKYDVLGRLLYTGITEDNSSHEDLIADLGDEVVTETWNVSNSINNTGYTCDRFIPEKLLTVNYYDNYNFVALTDNSLNYDTSKENQYGNKHPSAKGLLTGTRTYLLDGSNNYTATALYYDHKGQVIQSRSSNYLGGHDYVYNQYNFTGNVTKTLKEHNIAGKPTVTELYDYTYDHALRLKTTSYKLNNKPSVVLSSNTYDELGRLVEKKRHSNADTEEFEYNIRGWATKIKSGTTFEQNLYYNTSPYNNMAAMSCYNGNISATTWTYNGNLNGYIYYYDALNRLINNYAIVNNQFMADYQMSENFNYDKQGNIQSLGRWDNQDSMDQLQMTYNGNQLKKVTDNGFSQNLYSTKEYQDMANLATEFYYDANGNLTADLDRNIVTIKYNLLNLPEIIQFKNGNQIRNLYDARGKKLSSRNITIAYYITQPIISTGAIYDLNDMAQDNEEIYIDFIDNIGNVEYTHFESYYEGEHFNHYDSYDVSRIYNSEGYVNNFYSFHYYRRDHLGNNREVWRASYTLGSTTYPAATVQKTQYYPSGLPWKSNSGDYPGSQPYKYGGKEFVEMHGLDEYDSDARWYYPAIMRTTTPDPLAEKYYDISPYAWCANNPVRFVDPDGREVRVAKEYQEQFRNDLQNVFGDRTNMLSFKDNGTIQLDGKTKDFTKGMTKDQKGAFKGLYKAMNDKQVTSVVYADNYNITIDNEKKSIDIVQEFGGGLFSKTDNLIVIAPNVGSVDVTLDQVQITADGLGFPSQNVQQNTTSTLFHEIGERNTTNINFRGAVIDFENYARRAIGLPVRPYDLNHSNTIRTDYKK